MQKLSSSCQQSFCAPRLRAPMNGSIAASCSPHEQWIGWLEPFSSSFKGLVPSQELTWNLTGVPLERNDLPDPLSGSMLIIMFIGGREHLGPQNLLIYPKPCPLQNFPAMRPVFPSKSHGATTWCFWHMLGFSPERFRSLAVFFWRRSILRTSQKGPPELWAQVRSRPMRRCRPGNRERWETPLGIWKTEPLLGSPEMQTRGMARDGFHFFSAYRTSKLKETPEMCFFFWGNGAYKSPPRFLACRSREGPSVQVPP